MRHRRLFRRREHRIRTSIGLHSKDHGRLHVHVSELSPFNALTTLSENTEIRSKENLTTISPFVWTLFTPERKG